MHAKSAFLRRPCRGSDVPQNHAECCGWRRREILTNYCLTSPKEVSNTCQRTPPMRFYLPRVASPRISSTFPEAQWKRDRVRRFFFIIVFTVDLTVHFYCSITMQDSLWCRHIGNGEVINQHVAKLHRRVTARRVPATGYTQQRCFGSYSKRFALSHPSTMFDPKNNQRISQMVVH